jgi:hypothetical protein
MPADFKGKVFRKNRMSIIFQLARKEQITIFFDYF